MQTGREKTMLRRIKLSSIEIMCEDFHWIVYYFQKIWCSYIVYTSAKDH